MFDPLYTPSTFSCLQFSVVLPPFRPLSVWPGLTDTLSGRLYSLPFLLIGSTGWFSQAFGALHTQNGRGAAHSCDTLAGCWQSAATLVCCPARKTSLVGSFPWHSGVLVQTVCTRSFSSGLADFWPILITDFIPSFPMARGVVRWHEWFAEIFKVCFQTSLFKTSIPLRKSIHKYCTMPYPWMWAKPVSGYIYCGASTHVIRALVGSRSFCWSYKIIFYFNSGISLHRRWGFPPEWRILQPSIITLFMRLARDSFMHCDLSAYIGLS